PTHLICALYTLFAVFVFFQAEDGIRYRNVTGVQTCALPICPIRLASCLIQSLILLCLEFLGNRSNLLPTKIKSLFPTKRFNDDSKEFEKSNKSTTLTIKAFFCPKELSKAKKSSLFKSTGMISL